MSLYNGLYEFLNVPKMAEDLEAFLYSLPSLVRQAERNFHTDNVNTLELMVRRLDDSAFAVGVIVHNCLEYNANNGSANE
jgi:hypothetical protein